MMTMPHGLKADMTLTSSVYWCAICPVQRVTSALTNLFCVFSLIMMCYAYFDMMPNDVSSYGYSRYIMSHYGTWFTATKHTHTHTFGTIRHVFNAGSMLFDAASEYTNK